MTPPLVHNCPTDVYSTRFIPMQLGDKARCVHDVLAEKVKNKSTEQNPGSRSGNQTQALQNTSIDNIYLRSEGIYYL